MRKSAHASRASPFTPIHTHDLFMSVRMTTTRCRCRSSSSSSSSRGGTFTSNSGGLGPGRRTIENG